MRIMFFIGRLIVGGYYLYNGLNHFLKFGNMVQYTKYKEVPLPELAVIVAGLLLLTAGITFILGYFPEIGVLALVVFFIPVTFMMHNFWTAAADQKMGEMINFTKNMALMGSALMFLMIKRPWPLSFKRKKEA